MIGCDLISMKWFKSYLSNRSQAVSHKGSLSRLMSINLGVFQGSILGPLLFCIFINDLSRLNLKGEIVFFADDCSLILTGDTYQEVEECANHDLQLIEKWLKANRLILNVKKSNYLIINLNHRSINDLNIVICNERLIRVTKVKILGVFFDDRFVFDEHINSLSKKMNQRIGLLSRLRHFLPEKTLVIVYNSIVLPNLDYSLVLWGYTYSNHINRLITLQKRAVRVMTFSRFDAHSEPLFEKLDIMPLKKRLLFNSSIYIYKALNSLCSSIISKIAFQIMTYVALLYHINLIIHAK
jgi:hypothetical protein